MCIFEQTFSECQTYAIQVPRILLSDCSGRNRDLICLLSNMRMPWQPIACGLAGTMAKAAFELFCELILQILAEQWNSRFSDKSAGKIMK